MQTRTVSNHHILQNQQGFDNRAPCNLMGKEISSSNKVTQTVNDETAEDHSVTSDSENNCKIVNFHKRYSLNIDLKEIQFMDDKPDTEKIEIR